MAALQQICAPVSTVLPKGLKSNRGCAWAGPTGDFSKQQVGVSMVCVWGVGCVQVEGKRSKPPPAPRT